MMGADDKDVSDLAAAVTDALAARLVPQVGDPVETYVEPLSSEDERAFERKLDAVEPAQAAAAARLHTLFAG
jgi:hypothetical protein